MKSHSYEFKPGTLLRILVRPLLFLVVFALVTRLAAMSGLLPRPWPALDMDRTILAHQAAAARQPHGASVLLIGDSSCLMDAGARRLSQSLNRTVLNLGTLSYLDMDSFVRLVREYVQTNPATPHTVVLLVHPEFLRRGEAIPEYRRVLRHCLEGTDYCPPDNGAGLGCLLGLHIFKGRILGRYLPHPLPEHYADYYGFTRGLWKYMDDHLGSAVDPRTFQMQPGLGNADYRIAANQRRQSGRLRRVLAPDVKLVAGLTPLPAGFAGESYPLLYRQLLAEWGRLTGADAVLNQLPASLPDDLFASKTHLNERGMIAWTAHLSAALSPHTQGSPPLIQHAKGMP